MKTTTRRKVAFPSYYYASAKLVTPERHYTILDVSGSWDSEDEAVVALGAECQRRGVSMWGRRIIFTVIPVFNGRQIPELARTVNPFEKPLWTAEDLMGAGVEVEL